VAEKWDWQGRAEARLAALQVAYAADWNDPTDGHGATGPNGDADDGRFVLVERHRKFERGHWLTRFDSPKDASTYVLGQEYAGDWETIKLVDLANGDEYEPRVELTWQLAGPWIGDAVYTTGQAVRTPPARNDLLGAAEHAPVPLPDYQTIFDAEDDGDQG